jgi:hypothetical protein
MQKLPALNGKMVAVINMALGCAGPWSSNSRCAFVRCRALLTTSKSMDLVEHLEHFLKISSSINQSNVMILCTGKVFFE